MSSPFGGGGLGGTRGLDAGTGGVRDSYRPDTGSIASQAQYTEEIEKEIREGKKSPLSRLLRAIRRSIRGS